VKHYLDYTRAQTSFMFWDEAEMNEKLGLMRFLLSPVAVAILWILIWGLAGAAVAAMGKWLRQRSEGVVKVSETPSLYVEKPLDRKPTSNLEKILDRKPVRLIVTTRAEFEIDLSFFPEAEPVFAYVDAEGCQVEPLSGLVLDGRMKIENQPDFLWLAGTRDCVRLRATAEGRQGGVVRFRSLLVGEFCLEIYHVRPDQSFEFLYQNDFCFK
jgi:hypothetical protein